VRIKNASGLQPKQRVADGIRNDISKRGKVSPFASRVCTKITISACSGSLEPFGRRARSFSATSVICHQNEPWAQPMHLPMSQCKIPSRQLKLQLLRTLRSDSHQRNGESEGTLSSDHRTYSRAATLWIFRLDMCLASCFHH